MIHLFYCKNEHFIYIISFSINYSSKHMRTLLKQIKSYIILILIHNLVIFYIYSNTIQIYYLSYMFSIFILLSVYYNRILYLYNIKRIFNVYV